MALINKISLWFSIICLTVLLLSVLTVYQVNRSAGRSAYAEQLQALNDRIAGQLHQHAQPRAWPDNVIVREAATSNLISRGSVKDSIQWIPALLAPAPTITLTSYYLIDGRNYEVRSFLPAIGLGNNNLVPIVSVFVWLLLLFSVLVYFFSKVIFWYILSPFNAILRFIEQFENNHELCFDPEVTSTKEFEFLGGKLITMTNQVRADLAELREFSKYGPHELQTPTAVISGKLRMLVQFPLVQKQAELVREIEIQIKKLDRINDSLLLLANLRSGTYKNPGTINFSNKVADTLEDLRDWMEDEEIKLQSKIKPDIWLPFHDDLVDRLLPNILSNAIRHNRKNGIVEVLLDQSGLVVKNTVREDTAINEPSAGKLTSGLKILKTICDVSGLTFKRGSPPQPGWHSAEIQFDEKAIIGPLDPNVAVG